MSDGEGVEYDPSIKAAELAVILPLVALGLGAVGALLTGRFGWAAVLAVATFMVFMFGSQFLAMYYTTNPETIHQNVRDDAPVEFSGENDE